MLNNQHTAILDSSNNFSISLCSCSSSSRRRGSNSFLFKSCLHTAEHRRPPISPLFTQEITKQTICSSKLFTFLIFLHPQAPPNCWHKSSQTKFVLGELVVIDDLHCLTVAGYSNVNSLISFPYHRQLFACTIIHPKRYRQRRHPEDEDSIKKF